MIELIIEKGFLEKFTSTYNSRNNLHNDFCNFLKYIAKPIIYTDIEESDYCFFKINQKENIFLELLSNSNKPQFVYCKDLHQDVLSESFLKNKTSLKVSPQNKKSIFPIRAAV